MTQFQATVDPPIPHFSCTPWPILHRATTPDRTLTSPPILPYVRFYAPQSWLLRLIIAHG